MFDFSAFEDLASEVVTITSNAREAAIGLQALTVTVHGRSRLFTIVANGEGKVQEFSFSDDRYRALAPAELSSVITDALESLQMQVTEAAAAHLAEYFPDQLTDESAIGGIDALLARFGALGLLAPSGDSVTGTIESTP